ncbi:MAG: OmpH family outer membrane protein [Novosphingobium sp.]|nr:OmpH family outer membrane protein [Novosphingobium sp.]
MATLLKPALLAGIVLAAAPFAATPALAQAAAPTVSSGPVVPGLAVANLDAIVGNSNAFRTAQQQRATTYKATYDQAEARRAAIQAQLTPLINRFNADRQANPNNPALQGEAAQIQQIQESGNQELQRILQPVALSEAYVQEQITDRLNPAIQSAMTKQRVSLLLSPQAVLALNNNAYNLNQAILNELNVTLPSAQLVPPAGWEPREVREARAQQGAAPAAAAPAAPAAAPTRGRTPPRTSAGPQPEGR